MSDEPPPTASEPAGTRPDDDLVPDAPVADLDYQGPSPGSDVFNPKDHIWDGTQWWTRDRLHWWSGTRWRTRSADEPDSLGDPLTRWRASAASPLPPSPPTSRKKVAHPGDLWIGFFGTIGGNVLLLILLPPLASALFNLVGYAAFSVAGLAPWILNLGALILFSTAWPARRRIALGMLLAYGVALALGLLGAIILAVICFGGSRGVH